MIPLNKPTRTGEEIKYIQQAVANGCLNGGGTFTKACAGWMERKFGASKVLLTSSGTAALDMAAYLCDICPGDEVILPSFTFSSTAVAFVRVGAKLVFVDICPETMNCDVESIKEAMTSKTKVIVVMHYAGVSCDMDQVMDFAKEKGILVVEDAAHGFMSTYRDKFLGSIGDFGCYSFHDTKNYTMGEGGALVIRDSVYIERAEILWEKGTNRSQFLEGMVDKYTWVDIGDSYVPSEINAAFLMPQLKKAESIFEDRLASWNLYFELLKPLEDCRRIQLPIIPKACKHNAHIFYIKTADLESRNRLMVFLKVRGIGSAFHYLPLHKSPAGMRYGRFAGEDCFTTRESERLLRLPIYYGMRKETIRYIVKMVYEFYGLEDAGYLFG